MSLEDVANALRSPDGFVAEAVRRHRVAVEATAEAALQIVESLGLASTDDVDAIRTSVLLGVVAEHANNDRARTVLSVVASASDEIELGRADLPVAIASAVDEATAQIGSAEDIEQLRTRIDQARARFAQVPDLSIGLEIAQAIVADGLTTIYSATAGPLVTAFEQAEPPQPQPNRIRRKILRVAKDDGAGAGAGAVTGGILGGGLPGAAAGALVGAVGNSVKGVLKGVLDRVFPTPS